jgi:hypothetical protein
LIVALEIPTAPTHVPLAVEVDAAFGGVRIELTRYQQRAR